jgi:16S rRNA (cytosine967-C5)-methyltransferase
MDLLGPEKTEALLACNNLPAPLTLRANLLKTDLGQAAEALRAEGLEIKPLAMNGFFSVENQGDITSLKTFQDGLVTVQDPAAALPVYAASAQPGMNVLDCCAAPGGKSFLLAQEMQDQGSILSCDLHGNKLRRIEEGAQRLGIHIIETCAMDASRPLNAMKERFDLVLADVPCSGMGVIRKKPEIRRKDPGELASLPGIQLDILRSLADCVKPGGQLVYSTCTLLEEENEAVTAAFLRERPDYARAPLLLPAPLGTQPEGERTLWPYEYGTDGFYLCRMIREK